MEQDRQMLLANEEYVRSKYRESTSLSNKKAYQRVTLCKVEDNKEIPLVMNLSHEEAINYEIKLLLKQLKDINSNIEAVEYFLNLSDFKEYLQELKNKGDIDLVTEEGQRMYRALSKFDFVYKYNNTVGIMGKVDASETSALYVKLETYRDALIKEFNNPIINLDGAVWVGVAQADGKQHIVLTLHNGVVITAEKQNEELKSYFEGNILEVKDVSGKKCLIRCSEIAMLTVE